MIGGKHDCNTGGGAVTAFDYSVRFGLEDAYNYPYRNTFNKTYECKYDASKVTLRLKKKSNKEGGWSVDRWKPNGYCYTPY